MAVREVEVLEAVQWCPRGNPFDGNPYLIQYFLRSAQGELFGHGYGPGWSTIFGSEQGDIALEPGQWLVRFDDGSLAVESDTPWGYED